jgi:uroporphyrinogen decarboxylase
MARMNMVAWKDSLTASPRRRAIPIMTHPGIELLGKTVREAVTDGRVHFEAVRLLAHRFPSAAATMMMDLSVEAEAFGSPIRFADDEVPSVHARIVESANDVERLGVPSLQSARVQQYLLAARLAAADINDRPVFAGCIGPFSLAGRLYDMTEIMTALLTEPDTVHVLLEKCTQFLLAYVGEFKQQGANGILIAEPAAGVLSPDDCTAFSSVYVRRIVEALQDESFMVVLHNCGAREPLVPAMLSAGAGAFHFGNVIDLTVPLSIIPHDRLVMGNIDPVRTLKMAPPDVLRANVLELLRKTKEHRNHVLSTGCDSPPGVPMENVNAFYEALDQFNEGEIED